MKSCADCKHIRRFWIDIIFGRGTNLADCKHPMARSDAISEPQWTNRGTVEDVVIRKETLTSCKVMRMSPRLCGPEAMLFEPKEDRE